MGWLLSSACLLSLLYGLYEAELSPVTAAAYSSLSHSAWALGLAWIVIACSTGYGGEFYSPNKTMIHSPPPLPLPRRDFHR